MCALRQAMMKITHNEAEKQNKSHILNYEYDKRSNKIWRNWIRDSILVGGGSFIRISTS